MFKADLHCHTTCSDGTMTPKELILHAKEVGLSGLSITDHDTVAAYAEARDVAHEMGILLGVGAEFSSVHLRTSVHVLAYDFILDHPEIAKLCLRHTERRKARNREMLRRLSRLGLSIQEEELPAGHDTIGRPHIAEVMIKKGYVKTVREAFDLYIGDGKPCFDTGPVVSTKETIDIIHKAGGKAFLAHPHLLKRKRKLKEVFTLPFDGIECYYGRFSHDVVAPFLGIAKEKGWLVSGGSDFHGKNKDYLSLGASWIDEEHFRRIFQRL
ncbi:MAG: protein tRPH [Chlamydiota bacterium]